MSSNAFRDIPNIKRPRNPVLYATFERMGRESGKKTMAAIGPKIKQAIREVLAA